ncbi:MAG: hypothetical protein IKH99_01255 [Prevotella sp.]|nr:hypothetical protein [Prevotella sp.]
MKSIIQKNHHAVSFKVTCMMVITLLMISVGVKAQTVHIGLDNGSIMNAVVPGNDSGWQLGLSTLWRHEQLALTMMGSDRDELTESGGIAYPSAVFGKHSLYSKDENDPRIIVVGGRRPSYIVVSLPKGYRITSYTLVLENDMIGADLGSDRFSSINDNDQDGGNNPNGNAYGTMRFCEVKQWKTDKTNSGTHNRLTDEDEDGYNANRVRFIKPGTNWDETTTWRNGEIGTAEEDIIRWAEDDQGHHDIKTTDTPGKIYTIKRTAQQINTDPNNPIYDMDNHLYFRLVKDYFFYGITIKEFRIEFSSEGTFEAPVVPKAEGKAVSAVAAPFNSNKLEFGVMRERPKDYEGTTYTYYAFDASEIQDLTAFNYLYQHDAVANGVPADVANDKNIRPVNVNGELLYALKNDTYFIETPIEITSKNGNKSPIGYRIVGAKFTPRWGNDISEEISPGIKEYYITYTYGGQTYYLNNDGRFTTNKSTKWISDENGIHTDGGVYLGCGNANNNVRTLSTGGSNVQRKLSLEVSGEGENQKTYLYYLSTYSNTKYYLHGPTSNITSTAPTLTQSTNNNLAEWKEEIIEEPEIDHIYSAGSYTLKVWKRDGTAVQKTIEISDGNDDELNEVYDMGLCNNDAIKFEIADLPTGKQALVQVTLLLQALDPYIDKMDIVCTANDNVLHLTQSFTADDFSVSGGKFIFYVPEDYRSKLLTFTFSDLYSKYGDGTYYDHTGQGFGRYSFVTSEYFLNRIDGNGNLGLYQTGNNGYDPDHPYNGYAVLDENENETGRRLSKIKTSTAGNIRFKFNNAEDLQQSGSHPDDTELEEYAFTVKKYYDSTDPGDPLSATPHGPNANINGEFKNVQLKASDADQRSGTFFVFTADETRWNIATETYNWQHRFYAFYRMEIEAVARNFTPKFTKTKIYDKTFYTKEDGKDYTDSMWGLTVDVADTENGEKVQGYLTYQEIINVIQKGRNAVYFTDQDDVDAYNAKLTGALNSTDHLTAEQATNYNSAIEGANKKAGDLLTDVEAKAYNATLSGAKKINDVKSPAVAPILVSEANAANGPTNMEQILYIDGTPLYAMLNSAEDQKVITVDDLRKKLAKNSLVFLPENTTSTYDNTAFETSTGFHAGKDIVLTDKHPFFTPYDIQIAEANSVTYSREKSGPTTNDLVKYATVVLPFTMRVNNGEHVNDSGDGYKFNLRKLVGLSLPSDQVNNYYSEGNFQTISGTQTEANKPYMVEVTATPNNSNYSFVISQKGSTILATPFEKDANGNITKGDKYFKGDTYSSTSTALTNYGTYSGALIPIGENIYFFNKDKFASSKTLNPNKYENVNVRPFRAFYSPDGDLTLYSKMLGFYVMYDLFSDDGGITTSLTETSKPRVMTITTSNGSMLITAVEDVPVKIMNVNGLSVDSFNMNAGEQRRVNLPSGIYIVNNTKILVK